MSKMPGGNRCPTQLDQGQESQHRLPSHQRLEALGLGDLPLEKKWVGDQSEDWV